MKIFLKYTGEFLRLYPTIKFSKNEQISIRDSAINHLGLNNLNQLRDRYEGQSFFEKTMKNIGGLIALQKYLNKNLLDVNKINLSNFQPYIKINDKKIEIHVFDFGSLPLINVDVIKNPIFFIIQKDELTFCLCGLASVDVINSNMIETSIVKSSTKYYKNFIGFKYLKHVELLK